MKKINLLFTLSSLSVILVTVERFSFTTKVLLQPYSFMRLHEIIQMTFVILLTVIIPFLLIREVTNNFDTFKSKKGIILALLSIVGIYYYATGNGIHEVASFTFNQYCDTKNFTGDLCGGLFFNDYYTGNIFYFVGGALMVTSLMLFEKLSPNKNWGKKDMRILVVNAVLYAVAIFAYAAFDRVLVGLVYSLIMTLISLYIFLPLRKKYLHYPVISYTALTYTLGTLAAIVVRFTN